MKQIGNYSVEDTPIGTGGMGQVYRGISVDGYTPIAVKEILPEFARDPEFRLRIEKEINFLKRLDSNNVVKIFDYFAIGESLYIVMEYVDGQNLEQFVASRGRVTWQEAADIMSQLLQAMQYVHETGIVHRDIKPGNIMIRENGQVCLLDFGIAKDVNTAANTGKRQTVIGTVIGTDGYMSPEQAMGMDIDHRSDIYALGCLFFFMLTGTHAFTFNSNASALLIHNAIVKDEFPRLSDRVKGLPSSLQKVLDHATDKNMMKRFQSCREFANELAASLPGGTHINSVMETGKLSVSIGRENCDLTIGLQNYKVSRHHADVEYEQEADGPVLIYKDCSSNGTIIDGVRLRNGQSHKIGVNEHPEILLAGDADTRIDIDEIKQALAHKAPSHGLKPDEMFRGAKKSKKDKKDVEENKKKVPNYRSLELERAGFRPGKDPADSFFGAIGECFKKYVVFTGRASRAEYWWWFLFNFILSTIIGFIYALTRFEPGVLIADYVVCLVLLLPSLAVTVRRLHDIDKRGTQILLTLIPVAGFFFAIRLLMYLLRPGQPFANRFGNPPGMIPDVRPYGDGPYHTGY